MNILNQTLEKKIYSLPPNLLGELEIFVDYLLQKSMESKGIKLKQNWAGALEDLCEKYNSIELQKKSLEWR